jgi:uncharacterized protein (DUF433 family)
MSTQLPPRQGLPIPKAINPSYKFDLSRAMYNESKEPAYPVSNSGTVETEFKIRVSSRQRKFQQLRSIPDVDVTVSVRQIERRFLSDSARALADRLCERHPAISTNEGVLGGVPHIKGMRVSVAHVLAHLYHLGSVDAVVEEFKQRISAEQVKQALAYAHDFMEMACDPSEDDD